MHAQEREVKENKKMKPILIGMKVSLAVVLAFLFFAFGYLIDFSIIQFESLDVLIVSLYNVINFGLYSIFKLLWEGVGLLIQSLFSMTGYLFHVGYYYSLSRGYFDYVISDFFSIPDLATYNFSEDLTTLTGELYILIFQIIAILMIIYAIRSVAQNDPKYAIRTITYLNLMVIIPLILMGIEDMIQVFTPTFNFSEFLGLYDPNDPVPLQLPYPLNGNILFADLNMNISQFFAHPAFLIALAGYIYIEFAFQINYIHLVTSPSEERAERLQIQLKVIKDAAQSAIIDLEKIEQKEREEKEKGLEGFEIDEEGNMVEKKKTETIRQLLIKGATGFSQIATQIEKRKLEEKTKRVVEALRDTRRLSNYINKLLSEDPEAENTLTAKTSAPTAGKLMLSTVIDIVVRIIGITFLAFIVSNTPFILTNVFLVPASIAESVEMYTPEVRLTLLIPIILLFPMVSVIIRKTKESHLKAKLKEEQKRREEAKEIVVAA